MGMLKVAMKSVLTPGIHTEEEFQTGVVLAREFVNRRPLAYVTSHAKDPQVLTPNSFLRPGEGLPNHEDHRYHTTTFVKRWRHVQETTDRVWKRFTQEIIPQYLAFQKWKGEQRNLQAGDIVVLLGEVRRSSWPTGRVVATKEGSDGRVREAEVLFAGQKEPRRISVVRLGLVVPNGTEV